MNKLIHNTFVSRKLFFLLFCGMFSNVVFAQPAGFNKMQDTTSFKKKVTENAINTNTMQCSFKQVKHMDILSEDAVSKGKLWYKKESQLRWEYSEPKPYIIILNNGKASIKDKGKLNRFDMQSNKMFREINTLMMAGVQGKILESKDYTFTFFDNNKQVFAELIPTQKRMKEYLKIIAILFDKKSAEALKFRMTEASVDFT